MVYVRQGIIQTLTRAVKVDPIETTSTLYHILFLCYMCSVTGIV